MKSNFILYIYIYKIKITASVILKFCLERLNDLHSLQYLLDGILYILNNLYANIEIIKEVPKAYVVLTFSIYINIKNLISNISFVFKIYIYICIF